jgi:hypothetical protein
MQAGPRLTAAPGKLVDVNAGRRGTTTPPRGARRRLRAGLHGQPG